MTRLSVCSSVANDLRLMHGFPSGLVVMENDCVLKDDEHQVLGLNVHKELVSNNTLQVSSL